MRWPVLHLTLAGAIVDQLAAGALLFGWLTTLSTRMRVVGFSAFVSLQFQNLLNIINLVQSLGHSSSGDWIVEDASLHLNHLVLPIVLDLLQILVLQFRNLFKEESGLLRLIALRWLLN